MQENNKICEIWLIEQYFFSFAVPEMSSVVAVEGHPTELPCDISPPDPKEVLVLVLWYRQDEGEPIYR